MNKILYIILIAFLGLTAAAGVCDVILTLQNGTDIYKANSYIAWFLLLNVTAIIGSTLLLRYYWYHNYRIVFFTGTIAAIANLGYCYIILTPGLKLYYGAALLLSLCAVIVYSLALYFRRHEKGTG